MTFPLHVASVDSLFVSIDGGARQARNSMQLDPLFGPTNWNYYESGHTKYFAFDFPFCPVLLISGDISSSQPGKRDRLFSIKSRKLDLDAYLKTQIIITLWDLRDAIVKFAILDGWAHGINLFLSGLTISNKVYTCVTLIVESAGSSAPSKWEAKYDTKKNQWLMWTFPPSTKSERWSPDHSLMSTFLAHGSSEINWNSYAGEYIDDLRNYKNYIETYWNVVSGGNIPGFEEGLNFNVALQSAAIAFSRSGEKLGVPDQFRPVNFPITVFSINSRAKSLKRVSAKEVPQLLRKYM